MKSIMRIVLKTGYCWLGKKLIEMVKKAGKLQVWGIVVSIFDMDQNWDWLEPRKAVHNVKTIFQYILSGVQNTSMFKVGDFLH